MAGWTQLKLSSADCRFSPRRTRLPLSSRGEADGCPAQRVQAPKLLRASLQPEVLEPKLTRGGKNGDARSAGHSGAPERRQRRVVAHDRVVGVFHDLRGLSDR